VSTIGSGVRPNDAVSDRWEAHLDLKTASRLRVGSDCGAVGFGDGQPETDTVAAAGAVGAEPLEGLEPIPNADMAEATGPCSPDGEGSTNSELSGFIWGSVIRTDVLD